MKLLNMPESALEEVYEDDIKYLKPVLDVCTRWNSTYDMISRALVLQDSIDLYARSKRLDMDINCWDRFKVIYDFLKKFKDVSVYMCGDTYPTISMAVPNYNKLLNHIDKHGRLSAPSPTATSVDRLHNACVAILCPEGLAVTVLKMYLPGGKHIRVSTLTYLEWQEII